jgi:hypothetical protein
LTNSIKAPCNAYTLAAAIASPSTYVPCLDGDKGTQGTLAIGGQQQVAQQATANAMSAACFAAGGCDFLMSTGDNFYDLGIIGGNNDPQWTAYSNVYTQALFPNVPMLGTLGNHDYSILSPTASQQQIDYTAADPSGRWYMPGHNYQRVFKSASGAVSIQVVQIDSTPLHDRYLFSGASGGGYATDASGKDTIPNNNYGNAVLNSGVTAANGWTLANGWTGPVFNATNFQCGQCGPSNTAAQCGYNFTAGTVNTATATSVISSGCKYATAELGPLAHPAARAATWATTTASFQSGYGANQYQVMFSHFPVLSGQQRLTPWYDNATAMFATLGAAAPQIVFNGHDHIMAHFKNPSITSGSNSISFITSGAAGIADFGTAVLKDKTLNSSNYPTSGYATSTDGSTTIATLKSANYVAQPTGLVAVAKPGYNPDVNFMQFWSEFNGFTLSTLNATYMRVDFYLVNCTNVLLTGACTNTIGPLNTQYYPAKNITSSATTFVVAAYKLAGYSASSFNTAARNSLVSAIASDLSVATSAVTLVRIVDASISGRHLLQSSAVTVTFSVSTPTNKAAAVASGIANGLTTSQLNSAGLSAASGVTVATAPSLAAAAPTSTVTAFSAASALAARLAVAVAAVAALALAL